ncbi:MAG TPA: FKBP-type peptidyl-prolyl cis-trans isomerase [Chitinophagaceae bacterium]|nr:FKBP-type peptidyl-prolyl cis-trans isomerase [Chitinophagaceae bacterium]
MITLAALTGLAACHRSDYKTLPSGLKYKIFDPHTGPKAKTGDFLKLQIRTTVGDTVLIDTHSVGPREIPMQKGAGRYDVMEGLALLSAGDSAVFLIPADSVMKGPQRPPFVKKGDTISVHVKVLAIQTAEERTREQDQDVANQLSKDDSQIEAYLNAHHLTAMPTKAGEYIVVEKKGTGPNPKAGQIVSINYTGKTLDGRVFDSNMDTAFHHVGQPLTFPVGIGEMIRGMDDAVLMLNKGTKASLFIPSSLGYGPQGPPLIGDNAILVFEIEVLDIKDAPKTNGAGGAKAPSLR